MNVFRVFSVKGLGYMLNNINFVALHVFDVHDSFAISSQGHFVKFDAILMLFD